MKHNKQPARFSSKRPEKTLHLPQRRLLEAEPEFIVSPEDKVCDDKTLRRFKETNNLRVFHYLGVIKLRICICVFGCITNAPAVLRWEENVLSWTHQRLVRAFSGVFSQLRWNTYSIPVTLLWLYEHHRQSLVHNSNLEWDPRDNTRGVSHLRDAAVVSKSDRVRARAGADGCLCQNHLDTGTAWKMAASCSQAIILCHVFH